MDPALPRQRRLLLGSASEDTENNEQSCVFVHLLQISTDDNIGWVMWNWLQNRLCLALRKRSPAETERACKVGFHPE